METATSLFKVEKASFSAHGKFLLTGEYAVLDNVDALAIPLKLDQRLEIVPRSDESIQWTSYNVDGTIWFQDSFEIEQITDVRFKGESDVSKKLIEILRTALELVGLVNFSNGFEATTQLDFDYKSGMGTSSTLISMVSQWLGCDPYELQFKCFGGSGYDIACAQADSPIVYNYNDGQPQVVPISYQPEFKDHLFFVYLNQKQDSRDSIASFNPDNLTQENRDRLNEMPKTFLETEVDLSAFQELLQKHEAIIGELILMQPVKKAQFPEYVGAIKSLGGWGGDYVMVTGDEIAQQYFVGKGFTQIYSWNDVVLD
ncbi:Mevalonate kinase [Nonlabens sp. Hel1_33_55]|uniref:GYDIA family GHMP kinase n=1 Tax=Nonlabens sp. Hel1_33_55 TaxID=1336802 RepID=UPI000875C4F4|nr:GYDIA family GHMP kinase [Nonlabens sp. Hel1_33_55]SCY44518.1 Mevalonate kinase [Nonlabens sp. Hel1_33_55]